MKQYIPRLIMIGLLLTFSTTLLSQSISTQKSIYAPGEKITVNYSGFPGNTSDWVGISKAGTGDGDYIAWFYTGGKQSGTQIFEGLQYGNYEARAYFKSESVVRARQSFKVGNPDANTRVTTQKPVYMPDEKIIVEYSGFPGNKGDWVSIAKAGSGDGDYIRWFYTDGKQSSTQIFDGLQYGNYEVRGYYNSENVVRARHSFKVGNTDVTRVITQKPVYRTDEKIIVEYAGLPGNKSDWISIAKAGSGEGEYIGWFYTDGKPSGTFTFNNQQEGDYEARAFFNGESVVRSRYSFKVQKGITSTGTGRSFCRGPLSVFFAGMTGLGTAWGRTTTEPTVMTAMGVAAMQGVLSNARDALNIMGNCISFDINRLNSLISRLPSLTNVQAEVEIRGLILELQTAIAQSQATCDNGVTLSSLFVSGVHLGAAQAHASGRQCQPAPMPMAFQTVIRNHLNTARDAFANFLPCVPGVSLNQFDAVPLASINSIEAHTNIVGLHTNLLWNISLSNCCCYCK